MFEQPYQTYLLDYNPAQQLALYYYKDRKDNDNYKTQQKIKKIFLDIEVFTEFESKFPEPKKAEKPINAITLVNDKEEVILLFLKNRQHNYDINDIYNYIKDKLKSEYDFEVSNLTIYDFENETDLLIKFWEEIHNYDPHIILGFNADYFDFPYIINRTINLFGDNAKNLISKFGTFKINGFDIRIPEFQLVDILKLYKPGEGFGFGKNLPMFNLDTIAEEELGYKKVEHIDKTLDELYIQDLDKFLLYNIVDTYLIYLLDRKLNHFELFNTQRRLTYCPVSRAYHGRSIMGEQIQTFNLLVNENKVPRSFIVKEKFAYEKENEYKTNSLALSYYGAYVKQPKKGLYTGLIVDNDATSLYPSIMKMFNIEFGNLQHYLYSTNINKFMKYLGQIIDNKDMKLKEKLIKTLDEKVLHYVKDIKNSNRYRDEYKNNMKYINYFIDSLLASNLSFNDIINGQDYFLFKTKLIPLLDIVNLVLNPREYNNVVYDYLFMDINEFKQKYKNEVFYIYNYPADSDSKIDIVTIDKLLSKYFTDYIITISGALITKHEDKVGYIIQLITDMIKERKSIKKEMKQLDPLSDEYRIKDMIQLTIKVFINSLYGIYGLTTYRYNSVYLANTITLSGRLILKTAQYISEQIINEF